MSALSARSPRLYDPPCGWLEADLVRARLDLPRSIDRFLSRSNLLNAYSIYPSLVGQLEDGGISDVQRGGKKDENEVEEDEKLVDPVLGRS